MAIEHRRVYYSGRVQGVGFRYTARDLAQGRKVTGFVRNLDDGRVELVTEGERSEVESFLDAIRTALGPRVHHLEEEHGPLAVPPYRDFSIRY